MSCFPWLQQNRPSSLSVVASWECKQMKIYYLALATINDFSSQAFQTFIILNWNLYFLIFSIVDPVTLGLLELYKLFRNNIGPWNQKTSKLIKRLSCSVTQKWLIKGYHIPSGVLSICLIWFHVVVHQFSNRSHMMSKCVNPENTHTPPLDGQKFLGSGGPKG